MFNDFGVVVIWVDEVERRKFWKLEGRFYLGVFELSTDSELVVRCFSLDTLRRK